MDFEQEEGSKYSPIFEEEGKMPTREDVVRNIFNKFRYYNWQYVVDTCNHYLRSDTYRKDLFFLSYLAEALMETGKRPDGLKIAEQVSQSTAMITEDYFAIGKSLGLMEKYKEAYPFIKIACEGEFSPALGYHGWLWETGNACEKSIANAFNWYSKAAEKGNSLSQFNLGLIFYFGKGDFAEDKELSLKYFMKSASGGYPKAYHYVGCIYYDDSDYVEAVKWFRKGHELGDESSTMFLGECYKTGKGFDQNLEEAFKLYKIAAEKGEIHSQLNLAICYYNGTGTVRNPELAFKWHSTAAEKGCATSQYNLALHYQSGYGIARDVTKSYDLFVKSASQGNLSAKREIARCYVRGEGVLQDSEKGLAAIKAVVSLDGTQLRHAYDFQDNLEVINIAVKQNGSALEYVPDDMKASKKLCLIAVKSNRKAFQWVPKDLKFDLDIYMIANHMHLKLKHTNTNYQDIVFVFKKYDREAYFAKLRKIVAFLEYLKTFKINFIEKSEEILGNLVNINEDIEIDDDRLDTLMNQMQVLMDLLAQPQIFNNAYKNDD